MWQSPLVAMRRRCERGGYLGWLWDGFAGFMETCEVKGDRVAHLALALFVRLSGRDAAA